MTALSVFIVTYNSAALISACLTSLRAQSLQNVEIILVDSHSQDDTVAVVQRQFPEVSVIASAVNLGFAGANNLALTKAQGRYIVLLNPDAILPQSNTLSLALQKMQNQPDAGFASGLLQGIHGEYQVSARRFPSVLNDFLTLSGLGDKYPNSRFFGRFDCSWQNRQQAASVDWVPGAFGIIDRALIDRIGFFDPRFFLYYEEVDLCKRIHHAGYKVYYWPELVITHVGGASSESVDLALSTQGKQLTLWRMRSQALYYRKWHGGLIAWAAKVMEQTWHALRALRNSNRCPAKAAESKNIIALWQQAWRDTKGGAVSPPQPW